MRSARRLIFGFVAFGSTACQALWGMHPFEGGEIVAVGGGSAGASTGGQGPGCPGGTACPDGFCFDDECVSECLPGRGFCQEATLFVCNEEGDGLTRDTGETCVTPELCDRGRFQGTCPSPTCEAGTYECHVSSEGPIRARVCPSAQTEWRTLDSCESPQEQCSPDSRGCFDLGMDPTEVTRSDYSVFLAETADLDAQALIDRQPAACGWNTSFVPDEACLDSDEVCSSDCDDHPQVCVDWCDALAYCQAQGKSLCGTLGDQKNVTRDASLARDPTHSSWANACSAEAAAPCNPALLMKTIPAHEGCEVKTPGYEGLRGISGNVSEWEYACDYSMNTQNDDGGYCLTRGGSFADGAPECLSAIPRRRNEVLAEVGFRCCAQEASGGAGASSK